MEEESVQDWLVEVVNRELEIDSDTEEADKGTEIEDRDEEIEQQEEDQVVEWEDSELLDMTYSVIEVLESDVIPEVMPRDVGRRTRSGQALTRITATKWRYFRNRSNGQDITISNTIILASCGIWDMTGIKPVVCEKYEHFLVAYEIFSDK
jgi:hypothetical protein